MFSISYCQYFPSLNAPIPTFPPTPKDFLTVSSKPGSRPGGFVNSRTHLTQKDNWEALDQIINLLAIPWLSSGPTVGLLGQVMPGSLCGGASSEQKPKCRHRPSAEMGPLPVTWSRAPVAIGS